MIVTKTYPAAKTLSTVLDELFNTFPAGEVGTNAAVPVNIYESEAGYHLDLSVPGRNKEDFAISIDKNLLTASYEKKQEAETSVKTIKKEFAFASFKRSFTLDDKINAEAIEARYDNGILRLYLPKKEEVKVQPKQISVQ